MTAPASKPRAVPSPKMAGLLDDAEAAVKSELNSLTGAPAQFLDARSQVFASQVGMSLRTEFDRAIKKTMLILAAVGGALFLISLVRRS
jgi:hypothetical protein